MATGKITKRSVDALKQGAGSDFLWDDELKGFGVRITANGVRSYVFAYRMGGREAPKRRYTIGRHGSPWTPSTARDEAARLSMLVKQGVDPVSADKERRRQAVDLAFRAYGDRFLDLYVKREAAASYTFAEGALRLHAYPVLASKPLPTITRADMVSLFDGMPDKAALRRNVHAVLRRLFRWAVSRGDIMRSPLEGMEVPPAAPARDRVLSDSELVQVWSGAATLSYPFGPLFQLLIATGQRREEVAALDWGELDRKSATWVLPAARAKNGQAHVVPLNALAVQLLDAVTARANSADSADRSVEPKWPAKGLVLTTNGKTAVSGFSKAKARLDAAIGKAAADRRPSMSAWRVHDLRRTLATGLQRLGVRFEVTEAVLNHVSGSRSGVAGVYQRHDWAAEKRAALDAWGGHVESLISPVDRKNVHLLPIREQRAVA